MSKKAFEKAVSEHIKKEQRASDTESEKSPEHQEVQGVQND